VDERTGQVIYGGDDMPFERQAQRPWFPLKNWRLSPPRWSG